MLGSALAMLVLVSTFVAFGSWPGSSSGKEVDQLLLNDVGKPKPQKVAVRADAVRVARRAEARQRVALARGDRQATTNGRTQTQRVTRAPAATGPTRVAGTPAAAAPGGSSPASTVRQQTENVTQNLQQTTQNVGGQVQNQVDKTTTQVNQVVDQVAGGVQQTTDQTVQQVQNTVDGATNTVTGTVGGVKDTVGSVLGH
jgi:hypothetical protein